MDACFRESENRQAAVSVQDNQPSDFMAAQYGQAEETRSLVIELGGKIDAMQKDVTKPPPPPAAAAAPPAPSSSPLLAVIAVLLVVVVALIAANLGMTVATKSSVSDISCGGTTTTTVETYSSTGSALGFDDNYCYGTKPAAGFDNFDCTDAVANAIEQAGANVTKGFVGLINNSASPPITTPYYQAGLCPVNVHWHLGAEHLSVGEFDEHGTGPYDDYAITDDHHDDDNGYRRQLGAGGVRLGYQCNYYTDTDSKFTTEYDWQHCVDMTVGQTYEIHWPHSTVGACGTPYQYQTPFYDGVFCGFWPVYHALAAMNMSVPVNSNVGVQSQVFTIVNDENYYYPDLIKGAIVAGEYWDDVAIYTGSTTGTSRDNDMCSAYSPITWQVDRKCHMVSASSFDKMCADMKQQADDMTDDLYAHGARMLVTKELSSMQET